jgi:hypothetical protein
VSSLSTSYALVRSVIPVDRDCFCKEEVLTSRFFADSVLMKPEPPNVLLAETPCFRLDGGGGPAFAACLLGVAGVGGVFGAGQVYLPTPIRCSNRLLYLQHARCIFDAFVANTWLPAVMNYAGRGLRLKLATLLGQLCCNKREAGQGSCFKASLMASLCSFRSGEYNPDARKCGSLQRTGTLSRLPFAAHQFKHTVSFLAFTSPAFNAKAIY